MLPVDAIEEMIKITSMYQLQAGKVARLVRFILKGDKLNAGKLWYEMKDVQNNLYDLYVSDIEDWIFSKVVE